MKIMALILAILLFFSRDPGPTIADLDSEMPGIREKATAKMAEFPIYTIAAASIDQSLSPEQTARLKSIGLNKAMSTFKRLDVVYNAMGWDEDNWPMLNLWDHHSKYEEEGMSQ